MQQHEQVRKRKLVRNMVVCSLKKRSLDKLITPTQGLSLRLSSNATPSSTEEESAHHAPPPKSQHSICCSNFEGYKDPLNSSSVHPKHKPNKENIIFNQPKYNDKDDSRLAISAEFDAKLECFELHRNLLIENWEKAEVDRVRRRTKRKNPEIWRRIQVNRATVAQDLARAPLFVAGSGRGGQWPGGGGGGARGPGAAAAAAAAAAGALCPLVVTFAAPTGGGAAAEDGADAGGLGAEAATLFFEQLPRLAAPVPPGCRRGAAGGSGGGGGEKKRPLAGATAPLPRPFLLFEVAEGGSTLLPRPYRDENGNLSPLTPELQSMYFAVGKIILRSIIQRHAVPSAVASPLLVGRCVGQPPPGGPGGGRAAALARALLAADPGYSWVVRALRTIGTTFGEILSNGDQRLIQSDADKEECLRGFIEQQVIGPRRQQFDCISRGFTANGQINISPFLKVMTDEERQLLISGDEELSLEKLWSAFEFPDDNHNCLDETTIGLLRAALARMAPRDLRRCLKFATGRGALPLPFSSSVSSSPPGGGGVGGGGGAGGAGGGQGEGGGGGGNGGLDGGGVLRVRVRAFPDGRRTGYPRVHTCTHEVIEMPCYETLEELEERWMIAIQPENAAFTIL